MIFSFQNIDGPEKNKMSNSSLQVFKPCIHGLKMSACQLEAIKSA